MATDGLTVEQVRAWLYSKAPAEPKPPVAGRKVQPPVQDTASHQVRRALAAKKPLTILEIALSARGRKLSQ